METNQSIKLPWECVSIDGKVTESDLRAAPIDEQSPKEAHDKCTNTHTFAYSLRTIPIRNRNHLAFAQPTNPPRMNSHSPVCRYLRKQK